MGLFDGKKGLIVGVANERSIAWAIGRQIMEEGGQCGFSHLPDHPWDQRKKSRGRVARIVEEHENAKFLVPLDVRDDSAIAAVIGRTVKEFGQIDFLLHSVAFADKDDLRRDTLRTSRDGFKLAMEISVYSLIAVANAAAPHMSDRSAIATMTYFGGEKCVPGYNVMGICKSALESTVRYLAHDLGPQGTRVNALSAGPVRTLAGAAAGVDDMLSLYQEMAPLGRNITPEEVGRTGAFLLSDMSGGITGEVLHVDSGYNTMGSPGRMVNRNERILAVS